jgi:hypothetical protein
LCNSKSWCYPTHVPSSTPSLSSLEAKIAHTGGALFRSGEQIPSSSESLTQTYTGSFSSPTYWEAGSSSGQEKTRYKVTVIRDKAGDNVVNALSLGISGEIVTIGLGPQPDGKYAIMVMVPPGTLLTTLTPVITHTGVSVTGTGITGTGGAGTVTGTAVDFSAGKTADYRVTAENGGYRDYTVKVYEGSRFTSKEITGFYFDLGGGFVAAGVIDEAAKAVEVKVPHGTSLSQAPVIYHTGVSINPGSGETRNFINPVIYTVRAGDGSLADYTVRVSVEQDSAKAITGFRFSEYPARTGVIGVTPRSGPLPIVVTVPYDAGPSLTPVITHTGVSITGTGITGTGGAGTVTGTAAAFSSPQSYTVTAGDGSFQDYEVTVIKEADTTNNSIARIDGFYFTAPITAAGSVTGTNIAVTVPYGTNVSSLTAEIHYTGASIKQDITGVLQTVHPAHMQGDFRGTPPLPPPPLTFTVTAADSSTETYTVTVTEAAKILNTAREITKLEFAGVTGAAALISAAPNSGGKYPIEVTVPSGTTSLTPGITYTGASVSGGGISGSNANTPDPATATGSPVSFSGSPITLPDYTVTAENGDTKIYTVTVREQNNDDTVKEIDLFYFAGPGVFGEIDQANNAITVSAPAGTDLSNLTPTIYFRGASVSPPPGEAGDFKANRIYSVKARDGSSRNYTVSVTLRPSAEKEITGFSFAGVPVRETVIGAAEDGSGRIPIAVTVPESVTAAKLGELRPVISYRGASIAPEGETPRTANPFNDGPRNFAGGMTQIYRVTAEDSSVKTYEVTVHKEASSAAIITGFTFYAVPLGGGGTVPAAGFIDQGSQSINISVPYNAVLTGLAPVITWIGGSIIPVVGSMNQTPSEAHPFTDTSRDFSGNNISYKIKAENNSNEVPYTVTITKDLGLTISYLHVVDGDFLESRLNQGAGSVTLEIKASETGSGPDQFKDGSFEWYVDGKQLPVPPTTKTLTLSTSGPQALARGEHAVVAVAVKNGDGKHYTNRAEFTVE